MFVLIFWAIAILAFFGLLFFTLSRRLGFAYLALLELAAKLSAWAFVALVAYAVFVMVTDHSARHATATSSSANLPADSAASDNSPSGPPIEGSATAQVPTPTTPQAELDLVPEIARNLSDYQKYDDLCRTGHPSRIRAAACQSRDTLEVALNRQGWCLIDSGGAATGSRWHECT